MYLATTCTCSIQKLFQSTNDNSNVVKITSVEKKQADSNKPSSTFVVYTITISGIKEAKRRYSEFESFRKSLVKLYPTYLVPPIPEKHSLSDYTNQKPKDDSAITEKRKRMLERFLARIAVHPVLNKDHVFHRFLDGSDSWSDVLHSPPLLNLPRDPLLHSISENYSFKSAITSTLMPTNSGSTANSSSGGKSTTTHTNSNSNNSNGIIPLPSSSYTLKYPDPDFVESEKKVNKSARQATNQFEKNEKRILRRLEDLSNDYSELGSAYNALSLNETGQISTAIEKMGQVIDESCTSTKDMVCSLEIEFAEHVQDYTQYVYIAKQILKYRRLKQAQLELIEETIDQKKSHFRNLTKTQDEAQKLKSNMSKLAEVESEDQQHIQKPLHATSYYSDNNNEEDLESSKFDTESIEDGFSVITKSSLNKRGEEEEEEEEYGEDGDYDVSDMGNEAAEAGAATATAMEGNGRKKETHTVVDNYPTSASAPVLRSSKKQTKKWSSPRKLFSAVSFTLQGMIDTDPEQTRRDQIKKYKDIIEQLELARTTTRQELKEMSVQIKLDFERLQLQKEAEMRSILIQFAKIHMYYCEQNIASWKVIRNEISVTIDNNNNVDHNNKN